MCAFLKEKRMEKIEKYKLLGVMIRGFFEAFASGIIDSEGTDAKEKFLPKTVKRVMLEHYEQISEAFHDTLFYPIAVMNFDYAEVERMVTEAHQQGTSMLELVQQVCADEQMYAALKAEYIRNFSLLLNGRFASAATHLDSYTRCEGEPSFVSTANAIRLTVRTVMTAYAKGLRYAGKGKTSLHQASIFRLLVGAMQVLLSDEVVTIDDADGSNLAQLFMKVCHTEQNFDAMTSAMDDVYGMLCDSEGITAGNDSAN